MNPEVILDLLQTAVLVFVFLETIRLLAGSEHPVQLVFYGFAAASVLLSDLYWLAYDVLRPGTRMPFAANEIGEWAMFLLLGAALTARHPIRFQSAKREIVGAVLFSAALAFLSGSFCPSGQRMIPPKASATPSRPSPGRSPRCI